MEQSHKIAVEHRTEEVVHKISTSVNSLSQENEAQNIDLNLDVNSSDFSDTPTGSLLQGLAKPFSTEAVTSTFSGQMPETTCKLHYTNFIPNSTTVTLTESSCSYLPTIAKTNASQCVIHPVVLGNIGGVNLLSAAFLKRYDDALQSQTVNALFNGQLINVVPHFVQELNNSPVTSKIRSSVSTNMLPSNCDSNQDFNTGSCSTEGKHAIHTQDKAPEENSVKLQLTSTHSASRTALSSSDTVIIHTPSESIPVPLLSNAASENLISNHFLSEKSSVLHPEKLYGLLTNISDKSVSLESIPSIDLLKMESEGMPSFCLFKTESAEQPEVGNATPGQSSTLDVGYSIPNEIILGDTVPQSIVCIIKQKRHNIGQQNRNSLSVPSDHTAPHFPVGVVSGSCGQKSSSEAIVEHCSDNDANADENLKESSLSRSDTVILDIGETCNSGKSSSLLRASDTVILPLDIRDTCSSVKSSSLLRASDTVILPLDIRDTCSSVKSSSLLRASDTVILPSEESVQAHEKLLEGFSFTSFANMTEYPPSVEVRDPSVLKTVTSSRQISTNQHSESFMAQSSSSKVLAVNEQLKTLYLLTNDGRMTALRCILTDHAESVPRLLGSTSAQPHMSSQLPSSHLPEVGPKNVDMKETQTDLVFGTNTVYFRQVEALPHCSVYAVDNLPSTILPESLSLQTSNIPATVMLSDSTIQLSQPQSSNKKLQRTGVALASPATLENLSTNRSQQIPQETECGSTPTQISESQLPNASSMSSLISATNDSALFTCMKCQDKFETRQELAVHEKTHKKDYKCDLCNATFTRMGNYNRHKKIHSLQHESQHAFKCNDCGREFLQRCDLKRHLLIHTKQEPHRCEICGKGYIRHSDLVVHLRFHNKEKAFNCSLCDKKFFQSGDLNRHIRRAHKPNTQLTCGHCDRKYACETTLIRHMKAVHKDIILHTVNQRLQESDSGDKNPSVNTKDVLFTMAHTETDSKQFS